MVLIWCLFVVIVWGDYYVVNVQGLQIVKKCLYFCYVGFFKYGGVGGNLEFFGFSCFNGCNSFIKYFLAIDIFIVVFFGVIEMDVESQIRGRLEFVEVFF